MVKRQKQERSIEVRRGEPRGCLPWPEDEDRFFACVYEKEGKLVVRADLPGMKREDIDVAVEGDMLVIRGRRQEEKEVKEEDYYRCERTTGEFSRAISLPKGVSPDAIEVEYKDGVLEVIIPTPAPPQVKKVNIKAA